MSSLTHELEPWRVLQPREDSHPSEAGTQFIENKVSGGLAQIPSIILRAYVMSFHTMLLSIPIM